MIRLSIIRESSSIVFPINPPEIETAADGNNQVVNIVSLGDIVVPGEKGLATYNIESYFPAEYDPQNYVNFIMDWWDSKKPARFVAEGLDIDSQVIVESFVPTRKAGEESDIYYSLELKQYRPYGAKIIEIPTAGENAALPVAENRVDDSPPVPQTYTVKAGDSLWAITKRMGGESGDNWNALYQANKEIIGNNPNLIYPGQVLTIPQVWVTDVPAPRITAPTTTVSAPTTVDRVGGGGGRR